MADEEVDYESDPEETKLSLKMRRRVASDDEDGDGESRRENPLRRIDDSDGESEGAAAEYEDELEEEDYDLDDEMEGEHEESRTGRDEDNVLAVYVERGAVGEVVTERDMLEEKGVKTESGEVNDEGNIDEHEGEKKRVEPYSVPTAGAFYMHDDRFRDNAAGRHRRMFGERKLWESKDERKWGHDKFEELTMRERRYDERRRGSRGRSRGRGRNRGSDTDNLHRYMPREKTNVNSQTDNNPNNALKGVRGRGPQKYQPSWKKNEPTPTQNKEARKVIEKVSDVSFERANDSASNTVSDVILPRQQGVASSLSIASPPFYPSGSSNKENNVMLHEKVTHAFSVAHNGQLSGLGESFTSSHPSAIRRGKNTSGSIDLDNLSLDDSFPENPRKPGNNMHIPVSSSPVIHATQPNLRGHGRGMNSLTQIPYHLAVSNNLVSNVPPPSQLQSVVRHPSQNYSQSSSQKFARVPSGTQASSPPNKHGLVNSYESGESESPSDPGKSKSALVSKMKSSMLGSGRGTFLYGGAHVMGASGSMNNSHGDQNFPAFLPLMQFGGQNPGGMGVPAVGMAFPGYVGQPQPGSGNTEMTWLPVLAGPAGPLGASYCPPYISVDGSYQARPSGNTPSIMPASSNENNATKFSNELKPEHRPDFANEDSSQRQKNPRRYTEMKFDH